MTSPRSVFVVDFLPRLRVGRRVHARDAPLERAARIAGHREAHRRAHPHLRQLLGGHRRFQPRRRRIHDREQRRAGGDDVARVHHPVGDHARVRRQDVRRVELLLRRGKARLDFAGQQPAVFQLIDGVASAHTLVPAAGALAGLLGQPAAAIEAISIQPGPGTIDDVLLMIETSAPN